jgi:hypothetical protein
MGAERTSGRNQNAESYNHSTSQQTTSLLKVLVLWVLLVHGELASVSFNGFGLIKSSKEVPIEGLSRGSDRPLAKLIFAFCWGKLGLAAPPLQGLPVSNSCASRWLLGSRPSCGSSSYMRANPQPRGMAQRKFHDEPMLSWTMSCAQHFRTLARQSGADSRCINESGAEPRIQRQKTF